MGCCGSDEMSAAGRISGVAEGCPFCRAAATKTLASGVRFRLLSGYDAGRAGTVVQPPAPAPFPQSEFLAHMDGDPPSWQRRIVRSSLIETLPASEVPAWAPPIELDLAAKLDVVIVSFCEAGSHNNHWNVNEQRLFEIIRFIWLKRLPLEPEELWKVLKAHGVPESHKDEISEFFEKGRDLLVYCVGKKPIKKKRVPPLATLDNT